MDLEVQKIRRQGATERPNLQLRSSDVYQIAALGEKPEKP